MKIYRFWVPLLIVSTLVNLLSIKGFPLALGTLYLPVLFKVVQLQLNLSKGLVDHTVTADTFIHSNQKGIVISVLCCIAITIGLYIYLDQFYASLNGIWAILIQTSPLSVVIGMILYILAAIAVVQAVKQRYQTE
ncbi:hypothetical protein C7J88_03805 [Staphylococcus muscae]|uniref:Membrane protein n=1 Tax=Staphylococcus muscae TaxID=1294 RepID=A0A240C660_9STAP|nr:hypothetical protein [Staphylococcus muscae]AVQ33360.1 hypothetical protein C7J88_03805 [Staphylococcus muscae]PNZ01571.1 hypothetical protein CD131_09190 [Staphylococcus muscae]GGA94250.1 hypothetical protein GCM10007183_18060 [Staphylococcus muscae]SNW03092.1 membrane protein [Staphylococcus muscae]